MSDLSVVVIAAIGIAGVASIASSVLTYLALRSQRRIADIAQEGVNVARESLTATSELHVIFNDKMDKYIALVERTSRAEGERGDPSGAAERRTEHAR